MPDVVAGSRFLEVGRIAKPHGLAGEVVVDLITTRTSRLAPGAVLAVEDGALTVVASRRYGRRWLVVFEGVSTREAADALRGKVLSAEVMEEQDPEAIWVHEIVGAVVVDTAGCALGTAVAVVANPASDLIELDSGGLIPLSFVTGKGSGQIVVDPPPGLLD